MPSSPNQGISRRDLLMKGAILGGAVVWVTPIVQSVGMGRAFAQTTSPCTPPISYIAMNVTCPDADDGPFFFIKWEADLGEFGLWEAEPKSVPGCQGIFDPDGLKVLGDFDLGFSVDPQPDGTHIITVGPGCTVLEGVVKGGQLCNLITDFGVILPTIVPFTVGCPT